MVYLWDDQEGLVVAPYNDFAYAYKRHPKGEYLSIYGDRLQKIKRFKYDDPELFESDMSRETRVLTDLYLDDDMPSKDHHIMCIDIEVSSEGGFAKPETAENEITAIALYTYIDDQYMVFLLDPTGLMPTRKNGNETVISCKTEQILLTKFLDYYQQCKATVITGWNIDGYDIPYLYNRLKRTQGALAANSLSPINIIRYNQNRERYTIAGVSCLDYLLLYKKFTYNQKASYRLDAIGKDEIGMGKVEYDGTLDDLYKNDIEKFLKYNLIDVKIVVGIDQKMKLIELARFICHLGHVPYEDFSYSSKFLEGTIVTYLHRKGLICANKPLGGREAMQAKFDSDEEGFSGAFVRSPMPGLYEWVYSLDLASLYPSIIMSLNISPDTKMGRVYNWDVDKHVQKQIESYEVQLAVNPVEMMDRTTFVNYLNTHKLSISSNGILYSNKKIGIIPEILDKWFADRVEFKNTMKKHIKEGNTELADFYDRRQHVQKILLNSIYGVLGLPIFRFYDLDNALAVTATGQDVIKTTAKFVNSKYKQLGAIPKTEAEVQAYWNVLKEQAKKRKEADPPKPSAEDHCVYIDTDSVYFSAKSVMKAGVDAKTFTIKLAKAMEAGVNQFYDRMAKNLFNCDTHRFSIKGESVMETGFWVAKKRYAMKKVFDLETDKDMDGKLKVTGLDVVRSSFPPAFAKFMSGALMDILNKEGKDKLDKDILAFQEAVRKMDYMAVARNTSISDISKNETADWTDIHDFPKGTTAHQKAAITYNRLIKHYGLEGQYTPITNGDKIKWVYLRKNPLKLVSVALKTYDDPPQIVELVEKYIDYDLLFEKELSKKLADFYYALNWGELPTEVNQIANDFFSVAMC